MAWKLSRISLLHWEVVTLALNIRKFRNDVDAHQKQDEQILIQNSINVLRKFAE